jgi:DNA-3-methyladenine glycosylase
LKPATSKAAPTPNSPPVHPPPPLELAALAAARLTARALPRDTEGLARALIGTILVRVVGGELLAGRIVETEAYLPHDPASHAFRGLTPRNRAMFGPPLRAYVYFIYGANWCLNVTAECEGVGAAALVRACEPLRGIETMRALRGRPTLRASDLARGPGNLCRAFAIGAACDGLDFSASDELWLAAGGEGPAIGTSVRVGLTKAADARLRFYARGNPAVSGPRALSP